MRHAAVLGSVITMLVVLAGSASAARPLRTAILDPQAFSGAQADRAFDRARSTGASMARLFLVWSAVAPRRPTSPSDPDDPAYRWEVIDDQVRGAVSRGLDPLVYISGSVGWARGSAAGLPGTWPSPGQFESFARAAARRYSGSFRPDGAESALPRVRFWQAWNEPNAGREITPQRRSGRPVSPAHYRRLVNAFADAVHGVRADNVVVAGGLAPFGHDSRDIQVLPPKQFMSALLCVARTPPHRRTCSNKTSFDVWSHHPYTNGSPTRKAQSPDDASIGDLGEIRAMVNAARRAGTVVGRRAPQFWVTEISWDTSPPDPRAVPSALHARWVSEALFRMWSEGVSAVTWFRLTDDPLSETPYQSGFFTTRGRAKPSLKAFAFPFVAFRSGVTVNLWGRTPRSARGTVVIERRSTSGWVPVTRLAADRFGIFSRRLALVGTGSLRARVLSPGTTSVPFSLTVPPDRTIPPFGCGGPIPCRRA